MNNKMEANKKKRYCTGVYPILFALEASIRTPNRN